MIKRCNRQATVMQEQSSFTGSEAVSDADVGRPAVEIPINRLLPANSPRFKALPDEGYARTLADAANDLPPILVQAPSMRIVDGMQRVRAAQISGQTSIQARLFEGDDPAAFVAAVEANTQQGLRLSRAECTAAAVRILGMYPQWSDRAIAQICCLSDKTVGSLRGCATADIPRLHKRVGKDGRARPLDNSEGRRIARQLLRENPDASLRWVGRVAGMSPNTVRRVRDGMRRSRSLSIPEQQGRNDRTNCSANHPSPETPNRSARRHIMMLLSKDPALYMNDSGKSLLRWLARCTDFPQNHTDIANLVPSHCTSDVFRLALTCSNWWKALTEALKRRASEENCEVKAAEESVAAKRCEAARFHGG